MFRLFLLFFLLSFFLSPFFPPAKGPFFPLSLSCSVFVHQVGRTLYAFNEGLEVSNYPLARVDAVHELERKRVLLLRRINAAGVY